MIEGFDGEIISNGLDQAEEILNDINQTRKNAKRGISILKRFLGLFSWGKKQVEDNAEEETVPNTRIIITGLPNTGKSVLFDAMSEKLANLNWVLPDSDIAAVRESVSFGENAYEKLVTVVPGQDLGPKSEALKEAFESHCDLEGVIHVVDWGYRKDRAEEINEDMVNDGIDNLKKLRNYNLDEELKDLNLIGDFIRARAEKCLSKIWLILAITKCDLFEDKLQKAKAYYNPRGKSKFSNSLKSLNEDLSQILDFPIDIYVAPVSPITEKFEWNNRDHKRDFSSQRASDRLFDLMDLISRLIEAHSNGQS